MSAKLHGFHKKSRKQAIVNLIQDARNDCLLLVRPMWIKCSFRPTDSDNGRCGSC